jgi:acetyltransferase
MCIRCYKNVLEIEDEVDLAVVVVPSKIVKDVLIDCGKKNIGDYPIYSTYALKFQTSRRRDKV